AAPSDAPIDFHVATGDETSVHLTWKPPRFQYRNGKITQYQVRCYVLGREESTEKLRRVTANELIIADLTPETHACLVRAWTKVGPGPWSNRILFRIQGSAPPTPTDVHAFRTSSNTARLEWSMPSGRIATAHFMVYYTSESEVVPVTQWRSRLTKGEFMELTNLDPKLAYAVKVSAFDEKGHESVPSKTVYMPAMISTDVGSLSISRPRPQIGTERLGLMKRPDYYAVRNLKCASQTPSSVGLEWIGPVEFKDLLEYEITLNGRKEFLTEHGVLKSVHLGERQVRQPHQPATRYPSWYPSMAGRHLPDQLLQFLQVTDLEPYSRYEFTVRPLYHLLPAVGGMDQADGVPVTVICQTEWKKPHLVEPPELEAVHPAPKDSTTGGTLLELRIQRITEQNGPIHEYFVLISPYDCANDAGTPTDQLPDKFTLEDLSDNLLQPGKEYAPYLATRGSPEDLFKQNHNTAIVIVGSEHALRISRAVAANRREISGNRSFDGILRHIRSATLEDGFAPTNEFEIRVTNKPIDPSCIYRAALIACSKYPTGRYLCAYSPWSEPIDPKLDDLSNVYQPSAKSGRIHTISKFTILVIGLTCGLVFFALLSIILACVLRHRKRHLTERHILGSAAQWDAQFCGDVMKSMHADETATTLAFHTSSRRSKESKPFYKRTPSSGVFLNLSSSGLNSPSTSSMGLQMMHPMYPSAGGLAAAAVPGRLITSQSLRSTESPGMSGVANDFFSTNLASYELPVQPVGDIPKSPDNGRGTGFIHCDKKSNAMECIAAVSDHVGGVDSPDIKTEMGPTVRMRTSPSFSTTSNGFFPGRQPISVSMFLQMIRKNAGDWTKHAQEEFRALDLVHPRGSLLTTFGLLEQNRTKNRQQTVVPFDHNRVTLNPVYGTSKTDYINASYISGHRKPNAYIATQSPLSETCEDFWSMVWDQKSCTIVMLCRLTEIGENMCDRYWPIQGSCHYGRISVTHLETTELAYYVLRKFLIHYATDQRTVWQLQYTEWPKDQTPKYAASFLTFLRRTGAISSPSYGPVIVHCALGTSRTGIFISTDILLEQAKCEGVIDIPGVAAQLRTERMGMIETDIQYDSIYRIISEAIVDGNTEVLARNFFTHIQQLDEIQTSALTDLSGGIGVIKTSCNGFGLTGFQLEFRKINAAAPVLKSQGQSVSKASQVMLAGLTNLNGIKYVDSGDEALSAVNISKNRMPQAVPFDSNRVQLCPIRGVDGSDYINASFVDGYQARKAFIACQSPMVSTVEDFWRMVWEQKSDVIVMLCDLIEGGKEKCHQYWPSTKPSRYQFFVIDPTAKYHMLGHILREFKITDARDGESRTVRHFQYTRWPERGVPSSGDSLIDLIGQVHKIRAMSKENTPVTVHCSSGTGRTGVFIALSNVFERLRQESVVDMYATVKLLRQQRVGLVQTDEQYRFCYLATLDYLTSFDLCTQPSQPGNPQSTTLGSPCTQPKTPYAVMTST
ncbi:Receptor-type tyrosine-protein phosphatase F, partial [Fasciola gigantica]